MPPAPSKISWPPERALSLLADLLASGHEVSVRVTGESMRPFLSPGDRVTLRRVPAGDLRTGDLVLTSDGAGPALLHRVIRRSRAPGGGWAIVTKGDAMAREDVPVSAGHVLGKVTRHGRGEAGLVPLDCLRARLLASLVAAASRHLARPLARLSRRCFPSAGPRAGGALDGA